MALKIRKSGAKRRPLKIGIMAPPGAGKTFTALAFAKVIEEVSGVDSSERCHTLVGDTEADSADLYFDRFGGWQWDAPEGGLEKTPTAFNNLLTEAVQGKYLTLIIDSGTHLWLSLKDDVDRVAKSETYGNAMAAWGLQKKRARHFLEALAKAPLNVIVTFRAETVTEEREVTDSRGKKKTIHVPVGVKPLYDGDPSYEFDLFASMDKEHTLTFLKARRASEQLDGKEFERPGAELIQVMLEGFQAGSFETPASVLAGRINNATSSAELESQILPGLVAAKTDPTITPAELTHLRQVYQAKLKSFPKAPKAIEETEAG
jgi:AAA domain